MCRRAELRAQLLGRGNIVRSCVRYQASPSVGTTRACLPIEGGESCWPLSSPPRRLSLCSRFAAPRAPPCFCKTCAKPEAADTDLGKALGLPQGAEGEGGRLRHSEL